MLMGMTNRPAWTLSEAAERTQASRSTLRRYQEAGKFPHAYKDSKNQWRFPVEDILAAGIELVRTTPTEHAQDEPAPAQTTPTAPPAPDAELAEKLRRMELDLAVEREKNAGLQKLVDAAETGRSDLRRALLILEAPKTAAQPVQQQPVQHEAIAMPATRQAPAAPPSQVIPEPEKRGWFSRFLNGE